MKTWECTECGKEIQGEKKPAVRCTCGANGKWKEVAALLSGTPLTMKQAIMNGLKDATSLVNRQMEPFNPDEIQARQLSIIENHILDFLRQKFGAAYLEEEPGPVLQMLAKEIGVV